MRQINIAMALIKQGNDYLLQHRTGHAKIGAANLIGAFGGKIDDGEEVVISVCRELAEETSLSPNPEDFRRLGKVKVESDHQFEPVEIDAEVFEIIIDPNLTIEANEGVLIRMTKEEALKGLHTLTPATRATFEELL